jgi:DNA-binding HxlR family transcriptional regulator
VVPEYPSFCPVAKAADVLCERWAILVVRELLCGSSRFTELRRGIPACPPATLSKRLKQLEQAGVLDRVERGESVRHLLTDAGRELFPIVQAFGEWGQRWSRSTYSDTDLDADELLWDVRRFLDPAGLGRDSCVVRLDLELPDAARKPYWFVVDAGAVDLCDVDPRREVDVTVATHLRTLTQVWMGDTTYAAAVREGQVVSSGPRALVRRLPSWLGQHPLLAPIAPAHERARVPQDTTPHS